MNKTPQTISEAIAKLVTIRVRHRLATKKHYDNWVLKQMFLNRKRKMVVGYQSLDLQMHQDLGSDLATSKFVLGKCHGQVRDGNGRWIERLKDLPPDYSKAFKLTAIKAAKATFGLLSEGIDNFVGLEHLEMLDLSDNRYLDDFACDQLARQFRASNTLREINLSFNPLITIHGLDVLFRIPSIERIIALETAASDHEEIDVFVLAAEDERQCEVLVHRKGNKFKLPELEDLRLEGHRITSQ